MDKKRVLILDGYARQTLPMTKGFKDVDCTVTVVCFSKWDVGYASRLPDHKILWDCPKDDYDSQERLAIKLIEKGDYDIVVPMTDYSAIYLAANKERLSEFAYIAVNDKSVFDLAINKLNTMRVCAENDIPAPKTLFTTDPLSDIAASGLQFPVVIKPKTACGSIGFSIIDSREHLARVLSDYTGENGELFVQEYVRAGGLQYNVHMVMDSESERAIGVASIKRRWFPLDGGAATCIQTIEHEPLLQECERLLKSIGWIGYADLDLIEDTTDGKIKVIEINPRISANVKLCFHAGVNVSKAIYELATGRPVASCQVANQKIMRCFLTDLLWFLKSKDRFKTVPGWFSLKNSTEAIFSWHDIKPFFTFCVQSAKNYKHAMQQRKRQ